MIVHALQRYLAREILATERSLTDPAAAPRATFRRLQRTLRGAEIARSSGFAACKTLDELRRLPVSDGESSRAAFERVYAGGDAERRVFGRSPVVAFGRTSGTTGHAKIVPINRAQVASTDRSLKRMVASYLAGTGAWQSFFGRRHVLLASRPFVESSPTGLPVVDISGWIPTRTWPLLRRLYLPRRRDLWIPERPARAQRTLDLAASRNVTTITGLPALVDDFARRAHARFGGARLDDLWPNLAIYVFGGVPLEERERERLRRRWFRRGARYPLHFVETYVATAACLGYGSGRPNDGVGLELREHLFTFRARRSDSTALLAHELEASKRYLLPVTTAGGRALPGSGACRRAARSARRRRIGVPARTRRRTRRARHIRRAATGRAVRGRGAAATP